MNKMTKQAIARHIAHRYELDAVEAAETTTLLTEDTHPDDLADEAALDRYLDWLEELGTEAITIAA